MKFFIIQIEIDAFKLYYLHFVHLSHRNILLVGWFNHKKKKEKTRCVVLRPDLFIATASVSQLMVKILFPVRCRIYNKYGWCGHFLKSEKQTNLFPRVICKCI